MKNTKAASRTNSPAEVVITVTEFRPVLSPELRGARDTGYTMKMKRPHPRVSLKDDTLFVDAPGAAIRLTIASSPKDKVNYYPAGITFVREANRSGSDALLLGQKEFLQRKIIIDGQTLTFTNRFKKSKDSVRYKFSVIIQRGVDGAIGIIDPGIEDRGTQP